MFKRQKINRRVACGGNVYPAQPQYEISDQNGLRRRYNLLIFSHLDTSFTNLLAKEIFFFFNLELFLPTMGSLCSMYAL